MKQKKSSKITTSKEYRQFIEKNYGEFRGGSKTEVKQVLQKTKTGKILSEILYGK